MWSSRRRSNAIAVIGLTVVIGAAGAVGALVGDSERIRSYFTVAVLDEDGDARITEVVDYDFGTESRRGIFREVPGIDTDSNVTVSSPDAPDDTLVTENTIRIGDPNRTITGEHRYTIGYDLADVAIDRRLNWNAVGAGWRVEMEETEIHILAPWEFTDIEFATVRRSVRRAGRL